MGFVRTLPLLALFACRDKEESPPADTGTWVEPDPVPEVLVDTCGPWAAAIVGRTLTWVSSSGTTSTRTVESFGTDGSITRSYTSWSIHYASVGTDVAYCDDVGLHVATALYTYDYGEDAAYTYDPPILQAPRALDRGDTWTLDSHVTVERTKYDDYDYDSTTTYLVAGEEIVTVPAGTFQALRIDYYPVGYSYPTTSEWLAPDVGRVQYASYSDYGITYSVQLTEITDP